MPFRVKLYVIAIVIAAATAAATVWLTAPLPTSSMAVDAMLLCALGSAGEMLAAYTLPGASGSIGFIPFFAAAVLVPSWPSVLGVALVRVVGEFVAKRERVKGLFNFAAQVFMESFAILLYRALGGVSLLQVPEKSNLTHLTQRFGAPAMITFLATYFVSNLIVFVVIALASGRSIKATMIQVRRSTYLIDFLVSPVIFVFAWVYADFGPMAAAVAWVPILGLRQFYRVNLELERTNQELLELMVKSLEARDPYTSGHSRRVQHYSVIIARALGLSDSQVEQVGRAALLHDVGKIHEKYAPVLSKQDKLTPEEWAIIQEHPADGANLVATMTRLRDVVPAIRHHHENWDGTGYPDGLAGEIIPLAARIVRFADTIDAMTTERPYRLPLTEIQVRAEVVRCRGTQFDPAIADKLLSSALWSTLFTPTAAERIAVPLPSLSVVGGQSGKSVARTARGA